MAKKTDEKVCITFQKGNKVERTRFFKSTSKYIIQRKMKALGGRGLYPKKITRSQWEAEHGPINKPPAPKHIRRDLRFKGKTTAMKNWKHKQYFEFIHEL